MTQDATDELDLTPTTPPPVREDAKAPTPASSDDPLRIIFAVCTGQQHPGHNIGPDAMKAVAALKQERDRFHQILQMIATRPRIDPANPESLADVGKFAWTTARRILGIKAA